VVGGQSGKKNRKKEPKEELGKKSSKRRAGKKNRKEASGKIRKV